MYNDLNSTHCTYALTMISSTSLSVMVWIAGQVSMASWRLRIQSLASVSNRAEKEYVAFRAWSLKVKYSVSIARPNDQHGLCQVRHMWYVVK